jgi:23S rRNA (adenine2503-C2)-methyltransferase
MLISSCTLTELQQQYFANEPKFRSNQLFQAFYRHGAYSYHDVSSFPKALRNKIEKQVPLYSSQVKKELTENKQAKLIIELYDKTQVECVLLVDRNNRRTACLSCQVGCAMGCTFCKTGTLGLTRNLAAGEMVEQFLHLKNRYGMLDNVVFMGMGEPTANLINVLKCINLLCDEEGLNMSPKRFTISTCGRVEGIMAIAYQRPEVTLAFSLVTADEMLRQKIMPSAKINPLPEIKKALQVYQKASNKRITLEIALLPDHNNRSKDAHMIAQFAHGLDVMINVIPWNPIASLPYRSPTEDEIQNFIYLLEDAGMLTVRRYRRAATIGGACGQLG